MSADQDPDGPAADGHARNVDRNFEELLGELRVALPGVQVLFAFLLVVPFNSRFSDLSDTQRGLYLTSLLFAAVATIVLMAPTARHRWTFRMHDKEQLVDLANRDLLLGLGALATAMSFAIALVTSFVFSSPIALASTWAVALGFAWAWLIAPLARRHRLRN